MVSLESSHRASALLCHRLWLRAQKCAVWSLPVLGPFSCFGNSGQVFNHPKSFMSEADINNSRFDNERKWLWNAQNILRPVTTSLAAHDFRVMGPKKGAAGFPLPRMGTRESRCQDFPGLRGAGCSLCPLGGGCYGRTGWLE